MTKMLSLFADKNNLQVQNRLLALLQVFLGGLYIALLAQFEIPLKPVPITLHTFAIFTLALYYEKNRAAYSVLVYLAAATLGLPVFPHLYSDPYWFFGPSAGFCLSFPFAAYAISFLSCSKEVSFLRSCFSIMAGQGIIYLFGVVWLSYFLGINEALAVGLYPFIPMAIMKMLAAASLKMAAHKCGEYLRNFFY